MQSSRNFLKRMNQIFVQKSIVFKSKLKSSKNVFKRNKPRLTIRETKLRLLKVDSGIGIDTADILMLIHSEKEILNNVSSCYLIPTFNKIIKIFKIHLKTQQHLSISWRYSNSIYHVCFVDTAIHLHLSTNRNFNPGHFVLSLFRL